MYREAKYFLLFPLVSIAILTFIASASASCITPEEREANKIRSLQTQMMVGALQCRGRRDLGQRSYYNQFVITHKTELSEAGKTLLGYFKRVHGDKFNFVMDKHVTNLANEISLSSRDVPEFCAGIATLGARIANGADLLTAAFEAPIAFKPNFPGCPVDRKTASLK